jgi:hypothetical protein
MLLSVLSRRAESIANTMSADIYTRRGRLLLSARRGRMTSCESIRLPEAVQKE